MDPVEKHALTADVGFDGGDLDCGNGLLLLIRQNIDPLSPGQLLEIRSTEISVDEDLPAVGLVEAAVSRFGPRDEHVLGRSRRVVTVGDDDELERLVDDELRRS